MRVSLKWLRDFIDIDISAEELAEKLTLTGLAVENIEYPGKGIQKIYTGRIVKIEPHPNADKLVICKVSLGKEELLQIVTGAPNVQEEQIVIIAVEGAKLAGGVTIKRAKFRGVESQGMLCSEQELGIPAEQLRGIMVLPPETPVGIDARPLIGLDDAILVLEITPNRGDCLSILGVAREIAAILKRPLRFNPPHLQELNKSIDGQIEVNILNPELCHRYVARLFTNTRIEPSPLWMQERLKASGLRPVNNIVDITNYVMLEIGQPLHAFDYDTLQGKKIIVRKAKAGEVLVSLDGIERHLSPDMLIIADAEKPVAIAGVMGGLETEVTDKTNNVLLESAYFNPASIRRTSKVLGLRSESSNRFEKGIDLGGCLLAANRAAQLFLQIQAGDVLKGAIDNYPVPNDIKKITLNPQRVNYMLGTDILKEEMANILTNLQFKVNNSDRDLLIEVPSYRVDINREIDLVEEIARLYGYNQIQGTLPCGTTTFGSLPLTRVLEDQIKDALVGFGLSEVITYSFINPKAYDQLRIPDNSPIRKVVKLQNPLSTEHSVMRTFLLPGLIEVLRRNLKRRVTNGGIFEIGKVFYPLDILPEERLMLAAAAMGETAGSWNRPAVKMDFYFLKGILENLLSGLGINNLLFKPERDNPTFHPGRTAIILVGQEKLGVLGELHPDVLENLELSERVVTFEIDFAKIAGLAIRYRKYQSLPRFPGVERDLAVLVTKNTLAQDVLEVVKRAGGNFLRSVSLFDVYEGKQVKKGYRSLAFSLKFQADDRTLTDEEVTEYIKSISGALDEKLGAELR